MTVICALSYDNHIYLGSDQRARQGQGQSLKIGPKWHCFDKHTAVGICGSARALTVVRNLGYGFFNDAQNNEFDAIEILRRELVARGMILTKEKEDAESLEASMLFVFRRKLYDVDRAGAIIPIEGNMLFARGSGADFAEGADYVSKRWLKTPEERIELALQAACARDLGCGDGLYTAMM